MADKNEITTTFDLEDFVDKVSTAVEEHVKKEIDKASKRIFFAGYAFGLIGLIILMAIVSLLEIEYENWMAFVYSAILFVFAYSSFYLYKVIIKWWED